MTRPAVDQADGLPMMVLPLRSQPTMQMTFSGG